jgi:hypothetical protein
MPGPSFPLFEMWLLNTKQPFHLRHSSGKSELLTVIGKMNVLDLLKAGMFTGIHIYKTI